MDYTYLINELNKASAFDLYRLYAAIGKELRNPNRINVIKQALIIGMELSYFDFVENRLIKARLLEVKQKNALVLQLESNKQFFIPYSVINLDSIDTEIYKATASEPFTANTLKVGDSVSFYKNGEIIVGIIKRINYKTVSIETKNHGKWRVGYPLILNKNTDLDLKERPENCLTNFKK